MAYRKIRLTFRQWLRYRHLQRFNKLYGGRVPSHMVRRMARKA